jgi:hypothetical protein
MTHPPRSLGTSEEVRLFAGLMVQPFLASVLAFVAFPVLLLDGSGRTLAGGFPIDVTDAAHTRHEWARWDACVYTLDPDMLFDEFSRRGASFVKELSFIDEGLWGFEVADADGYVLAFFCLRGGSQAPLPGLP